MYGNEFVQTPAIVTNRSVNGTVTETPVVVTNTNQVPISNPYGYNPTAYGQYGSYNTGVVQTPAVVTNVTGGTVTQTPAVVTNLSGSGINYGMGYSGYGMGMGVGNVDVVPPPPQPASRSRIQYVPVEQKIVDYQTRQWIQTVPRQKTITEYQQRRWTEQVPREVTRTDHYAIQYLRQYVPEVVTHTEIQMVPQQRTYQTVNYVPVDRQINHGLQGTGMPMGSQIMGYGQSMNPQAIPMGASQGQMFMQQGMYGNQGVYPFYPGMVPVMNPGMMYANGTALSRSRINYGTALSTSGVRIGPPQMPMMGYGQPMMNGMGAYTGGMGMNMSGVNMNMSGINYGAGIGRGSRYTQTPAVVTNVSADGTVTETPVIVTNTC